MWGGRGPQLSGTPSKNWTIFGVLCGSKKGFKKGILLGSPFEATFGPSWPPLATTWPQKGPKMAPKRVPKEGPAGHVKSFVFDGRYFKIALTEGSQTGPFRNRFREPPADPLFDQLGGSWEAFWVTFGLQRGPKGLPKVTPKRFKKGSSIPAPLQGGGSPAPSPQKGTKSSQNGTPKWCDFS